MKKSGAEHRASGPMKEVLRKKLEGMKAAPSDSLWQRLEVSLDKQQVGKERKRALWYFRAAAAMLLMLLCVLGWMLVGELQPSHKQSPDMAQHTNLPGYKQNPEITSPSEAETSRSEVQEKSISGKHSESSVAATAPAIANGNSRVSASSAGSKALATTPQAAIVNIADDKKVKARTGTIHREAQQVVAGQTLGDMSGSRPEKFISPNQEIARPEKQNLLITDSQIPDLVPPPGIDLNQGQTLTYSGMDKTEASTLPDSEQKIDSLQTVAPDSVSTAQNADSVTQKQEVRKKKRNRVENSWAIGVQASGGYLKANVELPKKPAEPVLPTYVPDAYNEAVDHFNANLSSRLSYRVGLQVEKSINQLFSVSTGLEYLMYKQQTEGISVYGPMPSGGSSVGQEDVPLTLAQLNTPVIQHSTGNGPTYLWKPAEPYQIDINFQYLGVPLKVQARSRGKRVFVFGSTGVQLNQLRRLKTVSRTRNLTDEQFGSGGSSPFREWHWSWLASVGVGYQLAPQWQLRASADVLFGLSALTDPSIPQEGNKKRPMSSFASLGIWRTF